MQHGGVLGSQLHHAARAKRVIYLFMAGGPSQMETFDYKPVLRARNGEQLPESIRQGQRLTGMSGNQSSLPLAGSQFGFGRHGSHGTWVSGLLPHTASVVDDLCIVRSMFTEAINHDPAITFLQTGSEIAGRPSIGSWIHYGLGSDNQNLPAFVVLITPGKVDQPLYARLWGSGFLPSQHQGLQFRSGQDAVLYLNNAAGVTRESRRLLLDGLRDLHAHAAEKLGDTEVDARIEQYEMSYRMQASVPGVMDVSSETPETFALYGEDSRKPGRLPGVPGCVGLCGTQRATKCVRRLPEYDGRFAMPAPRTIIQRSAGRPFRAESGAFIEACGRAFG